MATHKKMWSTTHISLHERFTLLRSQQQRQQDTSGQEVRRSLAAQRQTSARNQRMLLQMERRPAVMAALKIKQKSVRQRLGQVQRLGQARGQSAYTGRVTDRLTTPGNRGLRTLSVGLRARSFRPQAQFSTARNPRVAGRSRGLVRRSLQGNLPRGRNLLAMDSTPRYQSQNRPLFQVRMPLNRSQFQNKSQFQSPNQNQGRFQNQARNQNRNQNQTRNQNRSLIQSQGRNQNRVQGRNQRRNPVQGRTGRGINAGTQPFGKGRGNARAAQSGFKGNQGNQRSARGRPQQRGSFRRGQGRGRGRQGPPPSKEELDKQLDQYMASTKTSLDKELDSYMNQSDS